MTGLQIAMILIGMVCLIASFFVSEKLNQNDLEEIKKMSRQELKIVMEDNLKDATEQIGVRINEQVEDVLNKVEGAGEKETNEKIMAISEYADTVLDSMNKTHDEIVFLYDMLNEKQIRVTELTKELTLMQSAVSKMEDTLDEKLSQTGVVMEMDDLDPELHKKENDKDAAAVETDYIRQEIIRSEEETPKEDEKQRNQQILSMYKDGMKEIDIVKQLGRGLGEIRLILGLFGEEQENEV